MKMLRQRVSVKYDTHESWYKHNPVLKEGELAIVVAIDGSQTIKIGDGKSRFRDLPCMYINLNQENVDGFNIPGVSISQLNEILCGT